MSRHTLASAPQVQPAGQSSRLASAPALASASTFAQVGRLNDSFERDAQNVADRVVHMPEPRHASTPLRSMAVAVNAETTLNSPGHPLDESARGFFERRLHWDLSRVRIHSDRSAAESAQSLAARAYTSGSHIVFGPGEYSPESHSGRHLIAHELAHVIQQTAVPPDGRMAPRIQRQAVPPEQFVRLIEEIDAKLADPKLSDSQRIELLRQRHDYWDYLREMEDSQSGLPASSRFTPPAAMKATTRFQSHTPATSAQAAPPRGGQLKSVPGAGSKGSQAASAKALAGKDTAKSAVPPPSTAYQDTSAAPRNPEEKAKRTEESAIGKRLNEMAVSGNLGDVRRVEGRRPRPGESSDYKFQLKDGSSVNADLYSPASGTPPENAALESIKKKSAQGDVLVLHLTGVKRPLEYAQRVAEALIVTPNHGLKRLIAFNEYRLVISRSLAADGKALEKIRQRVAGRLTEQTKSEKIARPERAAPQPRTALEPAKLSPKQIEQFRSMLAADQIKSLFKEDRAKPERETRSSKKGLFNDPRAVQLERPSGTELSTQGAVEGAGQIILGAQLESVRNRELQKALDAWDALQPKIEGLRSSGHDVKITVVAQVPKQPDVAAAATGVGNANEVVYFHEMYIAEAPFARRPDTAAAPPSRDVPDSMGVPSAEITRTQESVGEHDQFERPGWTEAMQETYEIYGRAGTYKPPKEGFRYETRTLVLPAH